MRVHTARSRSPVTRGPVPRRVVMATAAAMAVTGALGSVGCSGHVGSTSSSASTTVSLSARGRGQPSPTSGPHSTSSGARHLARSVPVRLQIAAIGVDSVLIGLGLKADGTMQVPPGGFPAGWYTGAPTPGELGPAIIAGHIDMSGPGVFYNLHNLKAGNTVTVTRKDGSKPVFRVTRVAQFPKAQFPTTLVYGNIARAGLRLITCGGSFNSQTGHYEDNIVAFAELVAPAS